MLCPRHAPCCALGANTQHTIRCRVNAISNTNSTNITEISTQRTSQSTYSAAAGIAREFNNDCYIAGAALIAAAVILL
ncbi:hypothetical protein C6P40_004653 [Pichia californica]|uniref:Uncharacterized protein n=1 Tax=Pichia californica TaxID=460514 RepID=A0A9P6WPY0_9ASCO|nr:hypothetical protein C6P42_005114 [[Candida] californica]KAG0689663.1 hypothetical protein C6P40_004653 [[Candida] californica]